ncbi:hypothetical protein N7493_007558 [Penicillium malachiteum]|uniref:Zn(2)-C6 fungal-type domain-containing protein n=1 Tax=Penicillium malachiteum TaxID=1324776 RepID=A0AAD6HI01_9EURO|nr:hypothetical protein N7493_007558 [Penicillium malachiteum]
MIYSFPQSKPVAKRRKVRRACDFCREHRVRCDGTLPCSQCTTNKVRCVKPKPSQLLSPARSDRHRNIRPSAPICIAPPESDSVASSAPAESPSDPPPVVARNPDCLTGFISRINKFCSVVSQISAQASPDSSELLSLGTSYSTPDLIQDAEQSITQSSPFNPQDLESRLLEIFWARYFYLAPIVTQADLLDLESDRNQEPLRNALMAYCLQSIYHAGLHHRLLSVSTGLSEAQGSSSNRQQSPLVKIFASYFQKALVANSHYLLYAEPALYDIQRHILMALFLLNSGEVLAAYNITGVAIRLAQSLDLHKPSAPQVTATEAKIRGRVWWTLVHLDFRCSRYLGKPMVVSLRDTAIDLPNDDPSTDPAFSELGFYVATITLIVVGKKVAESLAYIHDTIHGNDPTPQIELSAEHLTHEISRLFEWRDRIMKVEPFKNLVLVGSPNPPQTHTAGEVLSHHDDTWMYNQSPNRTLQQTLLELQFHDLVIWFHRPFIQFPSHDLVPQRSPGADIHATTALQHALKVTEIIHRRMLNHDALYGCSDVYQYVWNAVLTLVGFLLAYPLCYWFPIARQHVELSFQIFDTAKTSNPIASRAAHLTRYLLGRVDALMEVLNTQASASHPRTQSPTREAVAESWDRVDSGQSSDPLLPAPGTDDLLSWADSIDPKAWSGYCHEINDMLVDLPEISLDMSYIPL